MQQAVASAREAAADACWELASSAEPRLLAERALLDSAHVPPVSVPYSAAAAER